MPFCDNCNATIEWHPTASGKKIAIDPIPRPDGDYMFDQALRVVRAPLDLQRAVREANARGEVHKKRLYKCHFDTCNKRKAPAPFTCDYDEGDGAPCMRRDRHRHCFNCGSTDHLKDDCPQGDD